MSKNISLSPEDRKRIDHLVQTHFPGADWEAEDYVYSCIEDWERFVSQEVEPGYEFTIYDYLNDLWRRDLIQQILDFLSSEGRFQVRLLVEPIDRRFRRATRYVRRSVWYPAEVRSAYWWYHRVPERMGDDLRRDLRTMGIIR